MVDGALVTAQLVYRDMLRTHIAPRLRGLGFTGSGATYVLPDDARWLLLGFQQRNIRADCVRFTVNLTVADKETWDSARLAFSWLGVRPRANARFPPYSTGIRLGNLMPPMGNDRWWEVGPPRPSKAVATRILRAIEDLAVPWLRTGATRWPELVDPAGTTGT
jgi:hypothetical protein